MIMATRAGLGLQRNGHGTPVDLALQVERTKSRALLAWETSDAREEKQHDGRRITEDGAEAIALAVAHGKRGWRVVRRLQPGEHADWLLEQSNGRSRRLVALEVSGVDRGAIGARLGEKLAQVAQCVDVNQRWAGVVGFEEPVAALRSTKTTR